MSSQLDDYKKIISFYGAKNQKNKAIEEIGELIIALNDWSNVDEETADVLNMLNQLQIIYEIRDSEVDPVGKVVDHDREEEVKELLYLQRRIAQDFMGNYNRDKMVRSIAAVKRHIKNYIGLYQINIEELQIIMDTKNDRTLEKIEASKKNIEELEVAKSSSESWKGTDL